MGFFALCDGVPMNCRETHDMIQKLPISDSEKSLRQISDILDDLNKRLAYAEATVGVLKNHVALLESKVPIKL